MSVQVSGDGPVRRCGRWQLGLVAALLATTAASAATAAGERFTLTGTATLGADAPRQSAVRFDLRATMAASNAAVAAGREGARFELAAALSPASLACYNDTIFRDSFDGSGL